MLVNIYRMHYSSLRKKLNFKINFQTIKLKAYQNLFRRWKNPRRWELLKKPSDLFQKIPTFLHRSITFQENEFTDYLATQEVSFIRRSARYNKIFQIYLHFFFVLTSKQYWSYQRFSNLLYTSAFAGRNGVSLARYQAIQKFT